MKSAPRKLTFSESIRGHRRFLLHPSPSEIRLEAKIAAARNWIWLERELTRPLDQVDVTCRDSESQPSS
jgi:hypothetical protein